MARPLPEEKPVELNLTPMIDVVFQLLIFFMLLIRFSETEGRLLTTLPRHKGAAAAPSPRHERERIRIILCAGDPAEHAADRAGHARKTRSGDTCTAAVDGIETGLLRPTRPEESRAAANRAVCAATAGRVRDRLRSLPARRDPSERVPVVIDADPEVPYEHVIGIVNACQEAGVENLEFAAPAK